jgi:hypothetical protein
VGPQVYHLTWRDVMGTKGSFLPVRVLRRRRWPWAMGSVEASGGCQG